MRGCGQGIWSRVRRRKRTWTRNLMQKCYSGKKFCPAVVVLIGVFAGGATTLIPASVKPRVRPPAPQNKSTAEIRLFRFFRRFLMFFAISQTARRHYDTADKTRNSKKSRKKRKPKVFSTEKLGGDETSETSRIDHPFPDSAWVAKPPTFSAVLVFVAAILSMLRRAVHREYRVWVLPPRDGTGASLQRENEPTR